MSWEKRYRQSDTPWDKGAPAPPLGDLLKENMGIFGSGQILVPGCGRGHDARLIAKRVPSAEVIGMDISQTALKDARSLDKQSSVTFSEVDFLSAEKLDFPNVSAIFEHTCFCAIDPNDRDVYAEVCASLLPSGGHWIAIVFLTPREEDDPSIGPPFQSSIEEIHMRFGGAFSLINSYVPESAYEGRKGKELVMVWKRK